MKHLIKIIWSESESEKKGKAKVDISFADILSHPYFMSEAWMASFQNRVRSYNSRDRKFDEELKRGQSYVFVGQWLDCLEAPVRARVRETAEKSVRLATEREP